MRGVRFNTALWNCALPQAAWSVAAVVSTHAATALAGSMYALSKSVDHSFYNALT